MSFLDNPACGFACLACPAGSDNPAKTRMRTQRMMVAFAKVYLQGECDYLSWLTGADAKADEAAGAITIATKNGF